MLARLPWHRMSGDPEDGGSVAGGVNRAARATTPSLFGVPCHQTANARPSPFTATFGLGTRSDGRESVLTLPSGPAAENRPASTTVVSPTPRCQTAMEAPCESIPTCGSNPPSSLRADSRNIGPGSPVGRTVEAWTLCSPDG